MSGLDPPVLALLAALGLVGGIGITALGPGGVLATVALFALTPLAPSHVAGTAIVTHVATGALGTAAYARSGQLREPATRRTAAILAGTAAIGAPAGVLVNTVLPHRTFGVLLGVFVAAVGALVWFRERRALADSPRHPGPATTAVLGLGVAIASGLFGIGGPMLTVPLLVALRVPVLSALAAAQAQSVVVAATGTAGYVVAGSIDWPLAALIGVPELGGVALGWVIARRLPTRALKAALIVALFLLAPYLALRG